VGDVSSAVLTKVPVKCLSDGRYVASGDKELGDLRSCKRFSRYRLGDGQEPIDVDGCADFGKPLSYGDGTLDSSPPLGLEQGVQRWCLSWETVGEHVHIASLIRGRDLDAGDERDARPRSCSRRLRMTGPRVMVRDAHSANANFTRPIHQLLWCASAV